MYLLTTRWFSNRYFGNVNFVVYRITVAEWHRCRRSAGCYWAVRAACDAIRWPTCPAAARRPAAEQANVHIISHRCALKSYTVCMLLFDRVGRLCCLTLIIRLLIGFIISRLWTQRCAIGISIGIGTMSGSNCTDDGRIQVYVRDWVDGSDSRRQFAEELCTEEFINCNSLWIASVAVWVCLQDWI